MNIYSKWKLVIGVLGIAFVIFGICAMLIKGFDIKLTISTFIVLIYSIFNLRKAFSKTLIMKDKIEEMDERNQLVLQKSRSVSFKICQNTSIVFVFILVLIYNSFPSELVLGMLFSFAFIVFITFLTGLISSIYFESKL